MATAAASLSASNHAPPFRESAREDGGARGKPLNSGQWLSFVVLLGSHARGLLKQVTLLERAGIGAIAGGLAGGFTNATLHPIDTVKTKLQTRGSARMYSGPLDVVRKVFRAQGIQGFYCGLPAAVVGSVI